MWLNIIHQNYKNNRFKVLCPWQRFNGAIIFMGQRIALIRPPFYINCCSILGPFIHMSLYCQQDLSLQWQCSFVSRKNKSQSKISLNCNIRISQTLLVCLGTKRKGEKCKTQRRGKEKRGKRDVTRRFSHVIFTTHWHKISRDTENFFTSYKWFGFKYLKGKIFIQFLTG